MEGEAGRGPLLQKSKRQKTIKPFIQHFYAHKIADATNN